MALPQVRHLSCTVKVTASHVSCPQGRGDTSSIPVRAQPLFELGQAFPLSGPRFSLDTLGQE